MTDLHDLAAHLAALPIRNIAHESDLQAAIARHLNLLGIKHEREVVVAGGRIDFRVGRVGIEVKVKGSSTALLRQVSAYTDDPSLDAILVITTKFRHRLPDELGAKPIHLLCLGGSLL